MNDDIFECCKKGDLGNVKRLIEESKVDPDKEQNGEGYTPLEFVSRHGKLEIAKYLVKEADIKPEVRSGNGNTPLHYASQFGHLETVKYLVEECKVNAEVQNVHGNTPLHYASDNGHLETVKYLVGEAKVNPDIQNRFGSTPLHGPSFWGKLEIVKYFILHEVDTSIKNNDGQTFLDLLKGEQKKDIENVIEDLNWRKSNVKSRRF